MRDVPLRNVVAGPGARDRVLWSGLWFRWSPNARYDELLPRLERLDAARLTPPEGRVPRALAYRGWRSPGGTALQRLLLRRGAARYAGLLSTEFRQLALFPGPSVLDVDDTDYTAREAELLNLPQVRAYVVTTERAARRFEALGVAKPWHVVPQGVSLRSFSAERTAEVAARERRGGELVVGYVASLLFVEGDAEAAHPLYGVEHLLELWEAIRERVPNARLWLLGRASARAQARLGGRDDVRLFGWLPRAEALAHVAAFDVAVYPRPVDAGLQAVKASEYLGAGVPTVSYDHDVVDQLRGTGAALLVREPRAFVDAVASLAGDAGLRTRMGAAAEAAARRLDWDELGRRYEREVLDVHLPPRGPSHSFSRV
jgi:glycosyltransferase involved in cell wall biosynthesis